MFKTKYKLVPEVNVGSNYFCLYKRVCWICWSYISLGSLKDMERTVKHLTQKNRQYDRRGEKC